MTVPAHWRPQVVEALRAALRSKPGLSRSPLVSDATAALTALRADPGLPSAGVIVLCDFGGSGTSITLVDAAAKDAPIGETVRVPDFSGDRIDQAILTKIVAGIFEASDADPSGTAMVGSLAGLRDECRRAKERLSDETATAIVVDLPGSDTTVRMNRMELDDLIAGPLAEFLAVLVETLDRSRVPLASISAVATVGGGARIPLITQRLSEHLRTKVITTAHPQLTAAEGVALIAHRSQFVETATALAPAAPATATVAAAAFGTGAASTGVGALAWSEVEDGPHDVLEAEPQFEDRYDARPADSRPEVHFVHDERADETPTRRRGPMLLFGLSAAAVVIAAVVFGLTTFTRDTPTVPAGTSSNIVPSPASEPPAEVSAPAADAPAQAPASVVTTVVARPQQRVALQQPAVVQPAAQPPAAPAPPPAAPAPALESPAPQNPGTPTDPGNGTPPIDPGTGVGGTGTGTPPIDPGTGGGGTGTGTGNLLVLAAPAPEREPVGPEPAEREPAPEPVGPEPAQEPTAEQRPPPNRVSRSNRYWRPYSSRCWHPSLEPLRT